MKTLTFFKLKRPLQILCGSLFAYLLSWPHLLQQWVYDFESFHSYPHWSYWVLAGSVGLGFILASDHLVYVFEHKVKGNHKRAIGIGEMDDSVDAETKIKLLKSVANEYRKLYTNY